ncbi:STT3 domain-containing protein [Methanobacterium aggregans]|uniref:STT3 domain-containing protein n=1 Tax=Methanobacterium aggregans TaxID=1615586 RepID=UPI001AE29061|nr:STT3 domain-containing protein [Methanobacterium aggregans]MBP2044846.1 dolichyl-diphosphooligosaccharide--protein glycosyltransferase [Methanobacterium aggregans]
MSKNKILIIFLCVIIFATGFILRVESVNLTGIPASEQAYYQDQNGLPYMYDMDSYYNYRMTKNYIERGYMGDTKVNGKEWDFHSYAPSGVPMDYPPLIVYLTAFIYKFINLFAAVPLLSVCFWLPALFAPLAGVVAYIFTRRFTNNYGAAAAGILTVTAPFYFIRTVPAWFDTDMFNVLFPLLVTWLFIEAVQSENKRIRVIYTILSAFSMLLFSIAWNGWQYQFYIILVFSIVYAVWMKLKGNSVKNFVVTVGIFSVLTVILIGVLTGFLNVMKFLMGPIQLVNLSSANGTWAPWPDTYVSVSELGIPSVYEVLSGIGPAFFGGIFGLMWILRVLLNKKLKKQFLSKMTWFSYLLLVSWTIIGFFSLTKGARFIILLIPPLVISSGIMVGLAVDYLSLLKRSGRFKVFRRNKNLITILSLCLVLLVSVPAVFNTSESMQMLIPGANDDMWNAATWINSNTPNDTVIITDWSYGHFFSAVSDRPVAYDGRTAYVETLPSRQFDSSYPYGSKSPSTSREYWIDRAFSTTNESLSYGIFKMIATSGDMGYITLDKYTMNTIKSAEILNNILGLDKSSAKNVLVNEYHLNNTSADNVLNFTHPAHPRHFIVVNVGLKGSWYFKFGTWDFNTMQMGNYTYAHGDLDSSGNSLVNHGNLTLDPKTGHVTWNKETPYCVITLKNGTIAKRYLNKNSNIYVLLQRDINEYAVLDKKFENSLFTRIAVERSNSTYFTPIYENNDVSVWAPRSTKLN